MLSIVYFFAQIKRDEDSRKHLLILLLNDKSILVAVLVKSLAKLWEINNKFGGHGHAQPNLNNVS